MNLLNQILMSQINLFTSSLSEAMLHSLWQGLALVIILSVMFKMMEKSSARHRYVVAASGIFLQLLLFAGTFSWLHYQGMQASDIEISEIPVLNNIVENTQPPKQNDSWFSPSMMLFNTMLDFVHNNHYAIFLCWLAGASLLSMRFASGLLYINKLKKEINPAPEKWQERLKEISVKMGLKKKVRFVATNNVNVPTLIGWLKPVILMPLSLLSQMPLSEIDSIIAHELAHVKRHDYLVNLMQSIIEILLFFNPAVWRMSAWINDERENSCDDLALSVIQNHKVYIQALASLTGLVSVDQSVNVPHNALAATGKKGSVLFRIKRIMKQENKKYESPQEASMVMTHYFTRELTGKFLASFLMLGVGLFMLINAGNAQENENLKEAPNTLQFSLNDTTKKKVKVLHLLGDTLKLSDKGDAKFEFILSGDSSEMIFDNLTLEQTDSLHNSGKYRLDLRNDNNDDHILMIDTGVNFFVEKLKLKNKIQTGDTLQLKNRKIHIRTLSKIDTTGGYFEMSPLKNSDSTKHTIRIRNAKAGTNSVNVTGMQQEPLYILDGVIISSDKMKEITPSNIEKIDVLKGQKAFDSYGEKGNNGVIKITTKKGTKSEQLKEEEIEVPIDEKQSLRYFLNDEEVNAEKIHNLSPSVIEKVDVIKGNGIILEKLGNVKPTGGAVIVYTKPGVKIVEVKEGEERLALIEELPEIEVVAESFPVVEAIEEVEIEVEEVAEIEEVAELEELVEIPEVQKEVPAVLPVSSFVETFEIYPNPSDELFNINFSLKTAGMVKVSVHDMAGKKVATVAEKQMSAGAQSLKWKANGIAEGMYIINIERNGELLQQKVMLEK